jgi:hypothetical protein
LGDAQGAEAEQEDGDVFFYFHLFVWLDLLCVHFELSLLGSGGLQADRLLGGLFAEGVKYGGCDG